jgi:hypothetical protein
MPDRSREPQKDPADLVTDRLLVRNSQYFLASQYIQLHARGEMRSDALAALKLLFGPRVLRGEVGYTSLETLEGAIARYNRSGLLKPHMGLVAKALDGLRSAVAKLETGEGTPPDNEKK